MPRTATDYSKNVIYKIVCNDLNVTNVYVGHTTNLRKRKYCHKFICCNENDKHYNLKVYQIIRENGGWENWSMIEIEKYPCNDGNEAGQRERFWFEMLNANMNSNVPSRTLKDAVKAYKQEHREELNEKSRIYYQENKEDKKVYYEEHKEEIKERKNAFYQYHKAEINEKQKLNYQENKEKINEKNRIWYQKHKEEINERRRKNHKIISLEI
jgi:hypothetical protein